MATYFHGNSEILGSGGDSLQTLIFMNPAAYVGYSDHSQAPPPASINPLNFLTSPPYQSQHFVGVPLQSSSASAISPPQQDASAIHRFLHPHLQYNVYNHQTVEPRESQQQELSLCLFKTERDLAAVSPPPGHDGDDFTGSVLSSSKYLKAAQELLDEVANVGKWTLKSKPISEKGQTGHPAADEDRQSGAVGSAKRGWDLTTAERQEIQTKKAKLVNMLDEVDHRYRQYHRQMQIVITWFEQAAGMGSAKAYTAVALHTISKQFRCLKDAILGQIKASGSSSGGEEDNILVEGSKLKYVDNQIRQQRAFQQLGMIKNNAWRPQRGLPERSVSVLRGWLFEHFLHPYPNDSDKTILAKQTGLTRNQVSNWFINARVRLWKPMVEEMYMQEMGGDEKNGSQDKHIESYDSTSKSTDQHQLANNLSHDSVPSMSIHTDSTICSTVPIKSPSVFSLIGLSEMGSITQGSPKKPCNAEMLHTTSIVSTKTSDVNTDLMPIQQRGRSEFTLMGAPTDFIAGFGSYPLGELGRFGAEQCQAPLSGNGVSLTLGLQHCENLSLQGAHQTFMNGQTMHVDEANDFRGMGSPTSAHSTSVYGHIDFQTPKGYGSRLLQSL